MRRWKSDNRKPRSLVRRPSLDNHLNLGSPKPVRLPNSEKKLSPADHPGKARQRPTKVWAASA
jgi:hypothetical protein